MKITLANYEEFVLDFLEGNLQQEDERVFSIFLDQHPDIREEIEGVDKFVLTPDYGISYPNKNSLYHKDKIIYFRFGKMKRLVAAAVAFLIVSTASFFLWKSTFTRNQDMLANQKILIDTSLYSIKSNNPDPVSTVPESRAYTATKGEEPVNKAREHEDKMPVHPDNYGLASSTFPSLSPKNSIGSKTNNRRPDTDAVVNAPPQTTHLIETEKTINAEELEQVSHSDRRFQESAVAFLPVISTEIKMDQNLKASPLPALSSGQTIQTFRIHIPGEFLSETWTDMSLANFKKKVLPDFIIKQLNL